MIGSDLSAAPWLRADPLRRVLEVLNGAGEETRIAGGAVRDGLLGRPVSDVDLATTAPPDEVMRRARAAGLKVIETGIAHGTVSVVSAGAAFEVTTLRQDVETDGRHAVVRFGRDWTADAERRDFTMNALYATADGSVIDLVGGCADLAAGHVRFIGNAHARIKEDHLRILRLFRFHAGYGRGQMDAPALHAALQQRAGIERLSRERVGREVMKLLPLPGAPDTIRLMSETGFLAMSLGGVGHLAALDRLARLERETGQPACAVRRLAVLAVRIREDADRLRARLRLSNDVHARLSALAASDTPPSRGHQARILTYLRGKMGARDAILCAGARADVTADRIAPLMAQVDAWTVPALPVKAIDLARLGLHPGPALGAALRRAERAWISADFPESEDDIAVITRAAAHPASGGVIGS